MKSEFSFIRGKHVVILGLVLYLLSLFVGLLTSGVVLRIEDSANEIVNEDPAGLVVSKGLAKKIFVNNIGLNAIIVSGAFSLMAFSGIILMFNGLQIGYVVKGLQEVYGSKLAFLMVGPHLIVELLSHLLSLYLAYLLLIKIIVPLVMHSDLIKVPRADVYQMATLMAGIISCTFLGAVVEVYITPLLL
jgi:uncharacterized membrane protein SpoIIM required for sporulation